MRESAAKILLEEVRHAYDGIAADFSASRTRPWPEMERFKGFVKPGDHVLDIGCGNGRAYQLFAGMAIEYEGLDVSERLIALAKRRVLEMLAEFRVGSMLALPYEDASFDQVFAVAVLHHIPSREYRLRALAEARRVLKPGGRFIMTNWDLLTPGHFGEVAVAALKKLVGLSSYDFGDVFIRWGAGGDGSGADVPRYYHAFTQRGLHRLCADVGFEVEETYRSGGNLITVCRKTVR